MIDPNGVGHEAVPRGLRWFFWLVSAVVVGYALHGTLADDLVIPATRDAEALHLHRPDTYLALLAAVCFCLAQRAMIVDRCILFAYDPRARHRPSSFAILILSFALMFVAMMPRL